MTESASAESLTQGYGEFQAEASLLDPKNLLKLSQVYREQREKVGYTELNANVFDLIPVKN